MELDITNGSLEWRSENRAKNIKKIIKELKKINASENLISLLSELLKYNENQEHSFPKTYTLEKINQTIQWEEHKEEDSNLSCHLYKSGPAKRIQDRLKAAGLWDKKNVTVEELLPFDQMHYLGTQALDEAAKILKIQPNTQVLDVGAGFGGPARYLAKKYGCNVTAVEIQKEISDLSKELTKKSNMENRVTNSNSDILKKYFDAKFDYLISYLTFLHIKDKKTLWKNCYKSMKNNSSFYVEDYFLLKPLSIPDKIALEKKVGASNIPSKEEYIQQVEAAGFKVTSFKDVTSTWENFTKERTQMFIDSLEKHKQVMGEETANLMLEFYQTVSELFTHGSLGGVRINGEKKETTSEKIIFWNVDTQKDFMNEGGNLKVENTDEIKTNLKTITNLAKQNNITVVSTCDYHNKNTKEISEAPDFINTFPAHCMENTNGAEFIKETKPENPLIYDWKDSKINTYKIKTTRNIVIRKDAFDVFQGNPHTDKIVKLLAPNKVIVYGVTTNYCVNFAVLGLRQRNIPVYAVIDAMKEIPLEGEPTNTLNNWKSKGVTLIKTKDINSLL